MAAAGVVTPLVDVPGEVGLREMVVLGRTEGASEDGEVGDWVELALMRGVAAPMAAMRRL